MTKKQKELIRIYAFLMIPVSLVFIMLFPIFYEPVEQSEITSMDQLPLGGKAFSDWKTTGTIRYKWIQRYRLDEFYVTGHTTNNELSDFADQYDSYYDKITPKQPPWMSEEVVSLIQKVEKELENDPDLSVDLTTEKWLLHGSNSHNKIIFIQGAFDPDTKRFWASMVLERDKR